MKNMKKYEIYVSMNEQMIAKRERKNGRIQSSRDEPHKKA